MAASFLHTCKIVLLIICMFGSLFEAFYAIWKRNNYATFSCLLLEMTCVLLIHMHSKDAKGKLFEDYSRKKLMVVIVFGCVEWPLTLAGSIFLLVSGIIHKQGFQIEDDGYFYAFIPCVLANIWSAVLVYDARCFRQKFDEYEAQVQQNNCTNIPAV
ncbi:uncharacterized protein TNCV_4864361 [Trichonephila clavipes]|nr:uncharacterized protein TNCV_4864361 [Trichonephila clavipes]